MAGNTWAKRQREKAKKDRKAAKRARRDDRRLGGDEFVEEGPTQDELMEQFAALTQQHSAGTIDEATFIERRDAIYEALGVPVN